MGQRTSLRPQLMARKAFHTTGQSRSKLIILLKQSLLGTRQECTAAITDTNSSSALINCCIGKHLVAECIRTCITVTFVHRPLVLVTFSPTHITQAYSYILTFYTLTHTHTQTHPLAQTTHLRDNGSHSANHSYKTCSFPVATHIHGHA